MIKKTNSLINIDQNMIQLHKDKYIKNELVELLPTKTIRGISDPKIKSTFEVYINSKKMK